MTIIDSSLFKRVTAGAVLACVAGLALVDPGAAQSPFGVGLPERAIPSVDTGPLAGFFRWVAAKQAHFYKLLTDAVGRLNEEPGAFWLLAGLSFLYGVFHAAGPGHGKAIVSSYALANGEVLRRGVALAFLSSLCQAVTAVVLILIAAILLNLTSIAITDSAHVLELGSYAMVCLLGLWLVWVKALRPFARAVAEAVGRSRLALANASASGASGTSGGHAHYHHGHHGHCHGHCHGLGDTCSSHGHAHAPDPTDLRGSLTSRRALAVILSIGLRPCSGALIVLVLALGQQVLWVGIGAIFAMAVGTGLTVAILATLAVTARDVAVRLAGGGSSTAAQVIHRGLEAVAAFAVLFFGVVLLIAALR